ncbi:MAG: ClbS/DfsB family four-helix bundle protein [Rhodobacter sp.]|nr:ClbS/DfsB family four-helix bundle protein [Rhodobacter sp.]
MAATTKAELLEVTRKEFGKLMALLDGIDAATALTKREEDTSIRDVVAHRAHWIGLFLGWYQDGQAGRAVHFPAQGYKWSDLKRYNADLRLRQASLGWDEAKAALRAASDRLIGFLESQPDAALYGGPMKGAHNDWTTGRWAEAAGPSHFRSATKPIRGVLRVGG